jgi:hypothetical protein
MQRSCRSNPVVWLIFASHEVARQSSGLVIAMQRSCRSNPEVWFVFASNEVAEAIHVFDLLDRHSLRLRDDAGLPRCARKDAGLPRRIAPRNDRVEGVIAKPRAEAIQWFVFASHAVEEAVV